ncbi:hypothetical protein SSX86_032591 [Deinandra increscens subsp. villosa]|uniref:CTP synthase (glutamine hydrolyzing) n=1 Tax=Deinandra increscens subsp. villosa TaxID=3103831 RepID=A0AAP0C332_9ASTR
MQKLMIVGLLQVVETVNSVKIQVCDPFHIYHSEDTATELSFELSPSIQVVAIANQKLLEIGDELDMNVKEKLSRFCHVPVQNLVSLYDVPNIWHIPSLLRALLHASVACRRKLVIIWVSATDLEDATAIESPDVNIAAWNSLKTANAVVVPGGFGDEVLKGR